VHVNRKEKPVKSVGERKRLTFKIPDEAARAKGPFKALERAVEFLAPFERIQDPRDHFIDTTEYDAYPPRDLALAALAGIAESYNARQHQAICSPRIKEAEQNFQSLQQNLRTFSEQLRNMDDLSRFHLQSVVQTDRLDPKLLPQWASDDCVELVDICDVIAETIASAIRRQREYFGDPDRVGRQGHYERFLGSAKTRFVSDAFNVFENYRPGCATSSEGSEFFRFVHLVYQYATKQSHEEKVSLSHLLRSLITPLRESRAADLEYWSIETRLESIDVTSAEHAALIARQDELHRITSQLQHKFVPGLRRSLRSTPPKKT
jgi:hypothetical protein